MRILLDECVPLRLSRELSDHEVRSVPEMGWASQENGVLLALASGKFDVFVTTDQRLSYQQAISNFAIAVVGLVARRNKFEFLQPLVPELRRALAEVKPGEVPPGGCLIQREVPACKGGGVSKVPRLPVHCHA